MKTLLAIATKDLRLLARDRLNAFFTFIFPLLIAIFFAKVFGGGGGSGLLELAIVNEDGGPASVAFARELAATDGLRVTPAPTRAEGERLVRREQAAACVVLPEGFESSSSSILAGGSMRIEGFIDPSRKAEGGLLIGTLNEIGYRQVVSAFGESSRMTTMLDRARASVNSDRALPPGRKLLLNALFASVGAVSSDQTGSATPGAAPDDPAGGFRFQPVSVHLAELRSAGTGPANSAEVSFPQGIIWGLMGCVMAFATSLAGERARGTLMRLTCAPLARWQILIGKALACFVTCLLVQGVLMLVGVLFFGMGVRDPLLLLGAMVVASIGFVGVMVFIAGVSTTEGAASGLARAVVLVLAMIGGGTIPVMFMPEWMKTFAGISPFKWAGQIIQGALWRGLDASELALPAAVLLGMGILGFVIGLAAFRRSPSA
ncbi:MAG: ABC transporter permease [Phycisphaerales bacterium]